MKHYKDNNGNLFGFEDDQPAPTGMVEITIEEINLANETKAQADYAALPYGYKRAAEYPPIADYIDGVVKGDQAQIDAYIAACLAVKEKYPKQ